MKPKANYSIPVKDRCQTPPYALEPLIPYLDALIEPWRSDKPAPTVWEPMTGEGYLASALMDEGYEVLTSDILSGQDFLTMQPQLDYDVIVSNLPFSIKHKCIGRAYQLGKPFAFLVPVECIGTERVQKYMRMYEDGTSIMLLDRRVNFCMPNAGWVDSSAQFPVLWLCYKLLPSPIVYGSIYPVAYAEGEQPTLHHEYKRMLPYQIPMFEGLPA